MVSNKKILEAEYCRRCLIECMHVNLERSDCIYSSRIRPCQRCKAIQHIVKGVKSSKRLFANGRWE